MLSHDIVVVGASAGGIEALITLVAGLPPHLPAALFVVVHIPAHGPSNLAEIFTRAGSLPAHPANDGARILPGHIYVAQPDHHLLLEATQMRVVRGPREHYCRPAIDPLFRSAALAFGPRVVGIVLSGALNDGTAGLLAIKHQGGLALVQDPVTAIFPSMPESACRSVEVDECLSAAEISVKIAELASTPLRVEKGVIPVSDELQFEANIAGLDSSVLDQEYRPGMITQFSCPECSGPLWEMRESAFHRFRCRVGHAFTLETMTAVREDSVEETFWKTLNALDETALMYERLAARVAHNPGAMTTYQQKAQNLHERAKQVRQMIYADVDLVPTNP